MPLQYLSYISIASPDIGQTAIQRILDQSRNNNANHGISGHLQYHGGLFFQMLEGPGATLDRLIVRLQADPRHTDIRQLFRQPLQRRQFADWSMGFGPCVGGAKGALAAERLRRLHDPAPCGAERVFSLFLSLMAEEEA